MNKACNLKEIDKENTINGLARAQLIEPFNVPNNINDAASLKNKKTQKTTKI